MDDKNDRDQKQAASGTSISLRIVDLKKDLVYFEVQKRGADCLGSSGNTLMESSAFPHSMHSIVYSWYSSSTEKVYSCLAMTWSQFLQTWSYVTISSPSSSSVALLLISTKSLWWQLAQARQFIRQEPFSRQVFPRSGYSFCTQPLHILTYKQFKKSVDDDTL